MHDEIRNGKGHDDVEADSFFGLTEIRGEKSETCEDREGLGDDSERVVDYIRIHLKFKLEKLACGKRIKLILLRRF